MSRSRKFLTFGAVWFALFGGTLLIVRISRGSGSPRRTPQSRPIAAETREPLALEGAGKTGAVLLDEETRDFQGSVIDAMDARRSDVLLCRRVEDLVNQEPLDFEVSFELAQVAATTFQAIKPEIERFSRPLHGHTEQCVKSLITTNPLFVQVTEPSAVPRHRISYRVCFR